MLQAPAKGNANMNLFKHPYISYLCPETSGLHYMAVAEVPEFGPLFCRLDAQGIAYKAHPRELIIEDVTLNPELSTLNPKPSTLIPAPQTLHPKP